MMCVAYKLAEYGLEFIRKSGVLTSEDSAFRGLFSEIGDTISEEDADRLLKHCGMEMYFLFHKVITGKVPHDDRWYEEGSKITPIHTFIIDKSLS